MAHKCNTQNKNLEHRNRTWNRKRTSRAEKKLEQKQNLEPGLEQKKNLEQKKETWNRKKKLGTGKKKLGTEKKNLEQTKKLGTEIKLGTEMKAWTAGSQKNCGLTIYYFPRFYMHVTCTLPVLNADIMFCKFCDAWMQEKYKFFPTCGRKASENNTTTCATTFVEQFPGVDCFLENLFSVGFLRNFQRETSL